MTARIGFPTPGWWSPSDRMTWSSASCLRWGRTMLLLSGVGSVLGCRADTAVSLSQPPAAQIAWTLQLNQRAVNLALTAPYDILQLTATPLSAAGTPLAGAGPVTFSHQDSTVTVSPSGLITAHYRTSLTRVFASLQVHGVTLVDTAIIQVTTTAPSLALGSFSMQPAPGDSAIRTIDSSGHVDWAVTAQDVDNNTICSNNQGCPLLVAYSTSDPNIAVFNPRITINANSPSILLFQNVGHVVLTAQTWAYGVAKRDSVDFTVGLTLTDTIAIIQALVGGRVGVAFSAPTHLYLGVGAYVVFFNQTPNLVDVVFNTTTAIDTASITDVFDNVNKPTGSGSIAAFGGDTVCDTAALFSAGLGPDLSGICPGYKYLFLDQDFSARRFTAPGVYQYRSTLFPSETYYLHIDSDR